MLIKVYFYQLQNNISPSVDSKIYFSYSKLEMKKLFSITSHQLYYLNPSVSSSTFSISDTAIHIGLQNTEGYTQSVYIQQTDPSMLGKPFPSPRCVWRHGGSSRQNAGMAILSIFNKEIPMWIWGSIKNCTDIFKSPSLYVHIKRWRFINGFW